MRSSYDTKVTPVVLGYRDGVRGRKQGNVYGLLGRRQLDRIRGRGLDQLVLCARIVNRQIAFDSKADDCRCENLVVVVHLLHEAQ